MSEDGKRQIEGVCEEISEKNGWTAFSINTGSQYPTRLSTKLPALIEAGRAAGQQAAVWTFKESQGSENPNKPGTFYKNRYLEKVEVGGTLDQAIAVTAVGKTAPRSGDERRSIEKQTIIKAAITVLPADAIKTLNDWFAFLDSLDEWMQGKTESSGAVPAEFQPGEPDPEIPF